MQQRVFIELPSAPMQAIYKTIQKVGKANIPFFITGETGVGKEIIARYIHENGPRHDQPFIVINSGRLSAEFLQSELFGHEAGAFTSAIHQRRGAFEIANGGILFLDEVSEMPLNAQKMLLRILDTGTFTRLGGNEVLEVDIHIVASTNSDLKKVVAEKAFREDLYYRLKGAMLHIPPLRERPEDIAPLVENFITEFSTEHGKNITRITPDALTYLTKASWPGNIRQLRNVVQTAVVLATTNTLEYKDFFDIHPKLTGVLTPIWHLLPPETQNAIWETLDPKTQNIIVHTLSSQTAESWQNSQASNVLKTIEEGQFLDIKNMNLNQILRTVAQKRIQQYHTVSDAAKSLDIDTRTLQKYAQWKESDK